MTAKLVAKEFMLWALRKRRPWRVHGQSMEPEFLEGDLVLIDPTGVPSPGAVVVARHPFKNIDVIKYVKSIDTDGRVELESPTGQDSRDFGLVSPNAINGIVTYNWKRTRS